MSDSASSKPRYGWLGWLREPARAALFGVFRQALTTDDGRRLLADALQGMLPNEPSALASERREAPPYPDLGRAPASELTQAPPVFITGRFRSGSTLLWNLFRHLDNCRAYYEPLNERRWFDRAHRGEGIDATHIGVSDYWLEYEGLESLSEVFHDDWISRNLYMDAASWDADLAAYISRLIDAAAPKRAVLQFNRVDFRLAWLRHTFPDAKLIHLYRHPRDQWCSSLRDLGAFSKDRHVRDFGPYDRFYLLPWAADLSVRFPFLDVRRVSHPYQLFYYLWKLSWLNGRRYADYSVQFERLVESPDVELRRLLSAVDMAGAYSPHLKTLIVDQPRGKWRTYADEDWFRRHESECEATLQGFFGRETPNRVRPATAIG